MATNGTAGRVACLLGEGFEDSEFRNPYDRLQSAGFTVEVIGEEAGQSIVGKKGQETIKADVGIDDARPDEYEALLLPGGHSPDHLRADPRFVSFVRDFSNSGKVVAAVCHGPQLLISARLVRGRKLTAWKTIQEDLRQAGADVLDQPVVQDGNWVTSRQPSDLADFSTVTLEALRQQQQGTADQAADEPEGETDSQRLKREAAAEEHQSLAAERSPHRGSL